MNVLAPATVAERRRATSQRWGLEQGDAPHPRAAVTNGAGQLAKAWTVLAGRCELPDSVLVGDLDSVPEIDARTLLTALGHAADVASIGWYVVFVDVDPPTVLPLNATAQRLLRDGQRGVWDCVAPEERVRLAERITRRRSGQPVPDRVQIMLVDAGGQRVPTEVSTTPAVVDGRPATIVCALDVSVRTQATAALAASEARFRNLVESAPDGVAILRDGRFLYVNRPAARMLGREAPEQVVGLALGDLLEPTEATRAQSRISAMLQGGRHDAPTEYISRSPDGRTLHIEIASIPIDYEGAPAVLGFARDVTERRAIQERLLQADRLAAVGTLAAGVAHEINNPLAYSMLSLQAARLEIARADLPEQTRKRLDQQLGDALHGTNRVATIVRDLKTFARPTDTNRVIFSVNDVVRSALRVAHNELRHHAEVTTELECRCPVEGSPLRLEQAVLNLLVNAAQAMNRTAARTNTITVRTSGEDHAEIVVADSGPGIPAEILTQIFDPFFTTKPPGVGTGLGLPTCRSIVEWHGGTIAVASTREAGTQFVVTLPRATSQRAPTPLPPESIRPPTAGRIRLLLVDDEPALGPALQATLDDDFEIHHATSAEEALDRLNERRFEVILCDVMMPVTGGLEFYGRLRARDPALAQRVVFVTGGTFTPAIDEELDRTGAPVLAKPFQPNEVRRIVDRLLSTSAGTTE